jgi:hypothetical protein
MRIEMKCVCGRSVAFEGDNVSLPGDGVARYDVETMAERWARAHVGCREPEIACRDEEADQLGSALRRLLHAMEPDERRLFCEQLRRQAAL